MKHARVSWKFSCSLFGLCMIKKQMLGNMVLENKQTTVFPIWWIEAIAEIFVEYSHRKKNCSNERTCSKCRFVKKNLEEVWIIALRASKTGSDNPDLDT